MKKLVLLTRTAIGTFSNYKVVYPLNELEKAIAQFKHLNSIGSNAEIWISENGLIQNKILSKGDL